MILYHNIKLVHEPAIAFCHVNVTGGMWFYQMIMLLGRTMATDDMRREARCLRLTSVVTVT